MLSTSFSFVCFKLVFSGVNFLVLLMYILFYWMQADSLKLSQAVLQMYLSKNM